MEALRPEIREEAAAFIEGWHHFRPERPLAAQVAARREHESALVLRSRSGEDRWIPGPAGPLRLREHRCPRSRGVMLHIHGGGWLSGAPEMTDLINEGLARDIGLTVVSVDYRLAPEAPFPAGIDDCLAAAHWLIDHAVAEYGTANLVIGGESAGAHLAALTLQRLAAAGDAARFVAANLVFGVYDLGLLPQARGIGFDAATDLLTTDDLEVMVECFTPGWTVEDRRDRVVSPLFGDLRGLPPALFTVGTADHLADDTYLMSSRWAAAGNGVELLSYPDAPHGCIGLPTVFARWIVELERFLDEQLRDHERPDDPTT